MLNTKEICKYLQNYHCRITEQDILQPEATKIRQLYLCLLNIFTPGRMEEINEEIEKQRKTQPNFEYQEQNEIAYLIYKDMEDLLSRLQYKDLTYGDILDPRPTNIIKILSTIIDFIKYRGKLWKFFDEGHALYDDVAQACLKKQKQLDEFNSAFPAAKKAYEEDIAKIEKLSRDIQVTESEVLELRKQGQELSDVLDARKKERSDLKDRMQEIQFKTMMFDTEKENLQVAEAFDKEGTIERNKRLRESIIHLSANLRENEAELTKSNNQLEKKKNIVKKLQEGLKEVIEAKKMDTIYEKYAKEEKTMTSQIKTIDSNISRLGKEIKLCKEQIEKYEDKIQNIEKDIVTRREQLKQFNQIYRTRLEDAYKKCERADNLCAEMDKKTKSYNLKIQELKKRGMDREEFAEKKLSQIKQTIIEYKDKLDVVLND